MTTIANYQDQNIVIHDDRYLTRSMTLAQDASIYQAGTILGRVTSTGNLIRCVKTASDGSQNPVAVILNDVDATTSDQVAMVVVEAKLNTKEIIVDASFGDINDDENFFLFKSAGFVLTQAQEF